MIGFITAPTEYCARDGILARGALRHRAVFCLAPLSGRISPGLPGTVR
jgi:hypothetical protein